MKVFFLLAVCVSLFCACQGVYISRNLYDAIRRVETGGHSDPENAVGDGGRSIGPYQIMRGYYNDAANYNPALRYGGKTYNNCKGPGSYYYSEQVIQSYMNRYATFSRLGHYATNEDIARIHNGGPNGYKKTSTIPYWNKVKQYL